MKEEREGELEFHEVDEMEGRQHTYMYFDLEVLQVPLRKIKVDYVRLWQ